MIVCCFLLVFSLPCGVVRFSMARTKIMTLFYISWVSRRIHRNKSNWQCSVSGNVRGDILAPSSLPGIGPQYSLQSTHLFWASWGLPMNDACSGLLPGSLWGAPLDPCFSGTCHTELCHPLPESPSQHVECSLGIRDPWLQTPFFLACDNSLARSHSFGHHLFPQAIKIAAAQRGKQ